MVTKELCICDECNDNKVAITKCESCGKDLCNGCHRQVRLSVKHSDRHSNGLIFFSLFIYEGNTWGNEDIIGYVLCESCRESLNGLLVRLYNDGNKRDIVIGMLKNLRELAKVELL